MTKAEIIQKTLRDMGLEHLFPHPPYSDEKELEAHLTHRLPDGQDILVCEDFRHLGATCCPVCHHSYPHTDMYLIDLPVGGKAWICDQVRWAVFPEERGKLRERNWKRSPFKSGEAELKFIDWRNTMLEKTYIRDGKNKIVGSVTSGFHGGDVTVVRDAHENIIGKTSERFNTTRDGQGGVVSINSADPGLLINGKK